MVAVVVFEFLHCQHAVVVRVIVAVDERADGGDGAEEESPFVGFPGCGECFQHCGGGGGGCGEGGRS